MGPNPYTSNPADSVGALVTMTVGLVIPQDDTYRVPHSSGSLVTIIIGKLAETNGKIRILVRDCGGQILQDRYLPQDMRNIGIQLPRPLINQDPKGCVSLAFGGGHAGLAIYTINTVD
jgi:hypothetical protein